MPCVRLDKTFLIELREQSDEAGPPIVVTAVNHVACRFHYQVRNGDRQWPNDNGNETSLTMSEEQSTLDYRGIPDSVTSTAVKGLQEIVAENKDYLRRQCDAGD